MMEIVIFDTETTGLLLPKHTPLELQPSITEIYAVKVNKEFEIQGEIEYLVDPGVPIPPHITRITGITDKMVKGRPLFKDIAGELFDFMDGTDLRIAHNADFDNGMLATEYDRIGTEAPHSAHSLCTVVETMYKWAFV